MEKKIIYMRGLWSHPKAVDWIKNELENSTGLPVELFDYHDILTKDIDYKTYIKRILEKYGDIYSTDSSGLILIGHSHGGALSVIISDEFSPDKIILVNPAFRPWGVLRRIPKQFKYVLGTHGIGEGYHPHFILKYDGEIKERAEYFKNNFEPIRDTLRVINTGTDALKLKSLRSDLLLIQSLQDEFVSVSPSLEFYKNLSMPEFSNENNGPSKDIMIIPNAEHAILEEEGVYPKVYRKIASFTRR